MRANAKDLVGGGLVVAVGAFAFVTALGYSLGTARQMGPGYFPLVISGVLVVLGIAIAALSFSRPAEIELPKWRATIAVLASVIAFATTIDTFGLVPAVFVTIFVSALGDAKWSPLSTSLLAAGMALACWLVFIRFLGLSMPAFASPLG